MNYLIISANNLLKQGQFPYAFCGGYAIELFVNNKIRTHGDIDVAAFWEDRDKIILYMQSLDWQVYEMCGNGVAHHITDVKNQLKTKRNIFCVKDNCEIVKLTPLEESDMYNLDFDHSGQNKLNFIEILFNSKDENNFLYARNNQIKLPLLNAILYQENIPYLAPEIVLLYKSTDTKREGYQLDFDTAITSMNSGQKDWLKNALTQTNPTGHEWINPICH